MMGAEKTLVNVSKGQDPYSVIGNYISNHVTAIEDMIAVIRINGAITNELYMVDVDADGYFYWKNDWWEGEEDVALLDFFPVSDAERIEINDSMQPDPHYDEWCTDCKEYDQERHCCPRWNRVIRQTVKEIKAHQRWIFDGDCYKCNKCGAVYGWWADSQTLNYCPNCGVYMKAKQEKID